MATPTTDDSLATPGASGSNTYISYPTEAPTIPETAVQATEVKREVNKNRLYVGNLHSSVDEYAFLNVFSKYGKISKLDFLFHKSGPSKGKARGYAFVEYANNEDALKALTNANDKLLRGRKLSVTYANQAPTFDGAPGKNLHRRTDTQRPTALSLMKSGGRPVSKTEDKIAALEAKLTQMQRSDEPPKPSTLVGHPSLPLKPPAALPSLPATEKPSTTTQKQGKYIGDKARARRAEPMQINSKSLGKKPTLQELMNSSRSGGSPASQGLFRR